MAAKASGVDSTIMYSYRCVQCGKPAESLYKEYQKNIVKAFVCENCAEVVDKYTEDESMTIFLDILLHKDAAFRHVLFNQNQTQVPWKLLLVFVLCDTYWKWAEEHTKNDFEGLNDHLFYAALEWTFYTTFLLSLVGLFVHFILLFILITFQQRISVSQNKNTTSPVQSVQSLLFLLRGLILSSYSSLLAVPALVWGQAHSATCLLLVKIFSCTTTYTALRVMYDLKTSVSATMVLVSMLCQHVIITILPKILWSSIDITLEHCQIKFAV